MGVGRSRRRREMDTETGENEAESGEEATGSESLEVDIQSLMSYLIRR